jgi:Holliday junction resolvase RusA-like endonuclease
MTVTGPITERLTFFVPGRPVPQGSKTAFVNKSTGRPVVVDKDVRLPRWRMTITSHALEVYHGPALEGPVGIKVDFALKRPTNHFGTGRNADTIKPSSPRYPAVMPDLDKLLRAVFDGLTDAQVWRDDSQVVWCQVAKHYVSDLWPQGEGVQITLGVMR